MVELIIQMLLICLGVILAGAIYLTITIRKVMSVVSYTTFMSPCEILDAYYERYRPLIRGPEKWVVVELFPEFEEERMLVGRDPVPKRCDCPREYCLAATNIKRRRKSPHRYEEALPDGRLA